MRERLKKFAKFVENGEGLGLLLRIGFWIGLNSILIHLLPLPLLLRILTPRKISSKKYPREKIINFTSFWLGRNYGIYKRNCLKRSLVLYRYLSLQAEDARFLIGVRKENGELRGHSWIMLGNNNLFPEEDDDYRIIYIFPKAEDNPDKISKKTLSQIMD